MRKEFIRVEKLPISFKEVLVSIRKDLSIVLLAVATETIASPSYNYNQCIDVPTTQIALPQTEIDVQLEQNDLFFQNINALHNSLMLHRGGLMSSLDMGGFKEVAKQLSELDFTDSMVCYESEDRQITYDILDKSGLVLHLTQYLDNPKDQVVFSIEKDANFLMAGHTPIKNIGEKLLQAIDDLENTIG